MPTAEQFREELSSIFEEALLENRSTRGSECRRAA
jgi:hypothetical protein